MFSFRNEKNDLGILLNTPSYLELQIRGGIEDNSMIFFLISQ